MKGDLIVPSRKFLELDERISRNVEVIESASLELARDLVEMRDSGEWKSAGFVSLKEYAESKSVGKSHYRRLIQAGEFAQIVSKVPSLGTLPSSEGQLRPLSSVADQGEEVITTVWQNAVEIVGGNPPTSSDVERAVIEHKARNNGQSSRRRYSERERDLKSRAESGQTVVANINTDQALISWAMEKDLYVRVDRATKWGNPFLLDSDGDRNQVCKSYKQFYLPHKPSLMDCISELAGKVLGCHCSPKKCHADELARLANK